MGVGVEGGPDSQYPVENSTETARCCGWRKGYKSSGVVLGIDLINTFVFIC